MPLIWGMAEHLLSQELVVFLVYKMCFGHVLWEYPFLKRQFRISRTQTHGPMDPDFPLKDHSGCLGPSDQKLSMIHCSLAAPFNIRCSCFELFWLLGHKVQFLTRSFLEIPYSVPVKKIVASFIILCFPSHSCSLLCNAIVLLLQCVILPQLYHKLITFLIISRFVVQSSRLAL